jgi:M6 family metalloprotease-like protein
MPQSLRIDISYEEGIMPASMQVRTGRRTAELGVAASLILAGATLTASPSATAGIDDPVGGPSPSPAAVASGSGGTSARVYPGPFRVVQPDGRRVTVVAWGDAQAHGYRTPSGHAVVEDAWGVWRYAVAMDDTGHLLPSSRVVGRDQPPATARLVHSQVLDRADASHVDGVMSPGTGRGKQPLLVILASFTDQGPVGSSEATWADQYFGASGSVAAYYRQNSFNRFRLRPAQETRGAHDNGVVGWLKLPYPHPDFGAQFDGSRDKLTTDVLKAANRFVEYDAYDKDHDGRITTSELHIAIVVAGYDTSYGGENDVCGPSVWAHQGALLGGGPTVDGVVFDPDAGTMIGEWMCRSTDNPGRLSTIGSPVVLMGFDIGLPALWDHDQSSSGLGTWSLMSEGNWNRTPGGPAGSSPAMLDAFSKSYEGWITPTGVFGSVPTATLPAAATSPTAYRLLENPAGVDWTRDTRRGRGEYFLVENRQQVGWDVGLPACGVIVYHVDEGVPARGTVASDRDGHRLVDVVEASGGKPLDSDTYNGSAADVFPGSSGHVDFSDTTSPAASLYSGAASRVSMHVYGGCAPTMTADFSAPIPNDAFAAATELEGTEGSVQGGNSGATKQPGEPTVAGDSGGASIWYRFTAPADGELHLSTRGSELDTLLGVYRGTSVSSLTTVAEDDDGGVGASSAVTAPVERGRTYRVAIDGKRLGAVADQGLSLLTYVYRPGNDDLRDAVRLEGKDGRVVGATDGATLERGEPRKIAGQLADHSVWYTFKARADGRLVIDLSGSDFDTVLAVYTGTKVSGLHHVAEDDNSGEGKRSRVSLRVVRGTSYRVAVAGVNDAGKVVLRWQTSA